MLTRKYELHILCERCRSIFSRSSLVKDLTGPDESHALHEQYADLQTQAKSGCHFCSLIYHQLQSLSKKLRNGENFGSIQVAIKKSTAILGRWFLDLECHVGTPSHDQQELLFSFQLNDSPSEYPRKLLPHAALSQANTSSREHVELARMWIDACMSAHEMCNNPMDTPFVPTRLLSLGSYSGDSVSLYVTKPRDRGLRYCCLSHCWGGISVLSLSKENIRQLQTPMSLQSLPPTYRDAVNIARSLGIFYLWIDSLCIIQDSPEDWAQEAAVMASIYEFAYCTIAAAGAENSLKNCYRSRNPLYFAPCRVYVDSEKQRYAHPSPYLPEGSLDELETTSTLFTRAWIFQETLLSPRLLYFGEKGMCFSCRRGHAYEGDPSGTSFPQNPGDPFGDGGMLRDPRSSLNWLLHNELNMSKVKNILHYVWFDIVYEYSGKAMTRSTDKLIALSAIAQRVARRHGEEYLAGLWKSTIIPDLLWMVTGARHIRPSTFRAPSWSWASVDGTVASEDPGSVDDLIMNPMASLVQAAVSVHPTDTEKTGQIFGALLKLRGCVKRAVMVESYAADFYSDIEDIHHEGRVIGKLFVDAVTPVKSEVYFMPLQKTQSLEPHTHERKAFCQSSVQGLALYSEGKGYERFGMFSFECSACEDSEFYDSFVEPYFDGCVEREIVFRDKHEIDAVGGR